MLIEALDGPLVRYVRRQTPILTEPEETRSVPDPQQFDAALNTVTNQPRNVTNPAAVNPREGLNSVSQPNEIARRDLQQDSDGQIDYTILPNDNLWEIGERYGRSLDEIEVVNPDFFPPDSNPNIVQPGQVLTILNDDRTQIAVELTEATDPSSVRSLVTEDLQYTTNDTPTPGDQLAEAQTDLLSRRPRDAGFAQIVEEQGSALTDQWAAEGRTTEVWAPILNAAGRGDWQGVGDVVREQLNAVSETSPTLEAIAARRDMLLAYGPADQAFGDAVNQTYQRYVIDEPEAAAQQVEDAYQEGGALAASQILRDLTKGQTTSPLQAALIADAARPTVGRISADFVDPTQSLWHDEPGVGIVGDYQGIYQNLSAVAERISLSPEGEGIIEFMANTLQAHGAHNVDARSAAGQGSFVLSQEISERLLAQGDTERADQIANASNLVAGDFLPGLGVYVSEGTYLRSPTYELNEPGKISEVLLENGGTLSVYVGSGVDLWQRTTDLGPLRSPSQLLDEPLSTGRRPGGSTAAHDADGDIGLRIPLEPKGGLKTLLEGVTEAGNSSGLFGDASRTGAVEVSPALTLGARTYTQGADKGLQVQGFLSPELETQLKLGSVDDILGRSIMEALPVAIRAGAAGYPLSEQGQEQLLNGGVESHLQDLRLAAMIEPYLSRNLGLDPQTITSTRLGLNPTLTVDYFGEGQPLVAENGQPWEQTIGDALSELSPDVIAENQDILSNPGIPDFMKRVLIEPDFLTAGAGRAAVAGLGEIGEEIPFAEGIDGTRHEVAVTVALSGYVYMSEDSARRDLGTLPLTKSFLNSSIGITASTSVQVVYEPPVELTTPEIADIRAQDPVPFDRSGEDSFAPR